jgi:hypothetical protein
LYQRAFGKVAPLTFVFGFCRGIFNCFPSADIIAGTIAAITGICISKQALLKRFSHAPAFMHQILKIVIAYPLKIDPDHVDHLFPMFANVRLLDSTAIKLHPSLAKFFPGTRNQTGKQSASMKIQLCYNLTSGILDIISISPYTRNDQKASADIFTIAKPNDLVIRDLGYFSLDVLGQMVLDGIYFITRLRPGVLIFNPDLSPVNLLETLKKHDGIFDQHLIIGASEFLRFGNHFCSSQNFPINPASLNPRKWTFTIIEFISYRCTYEKRKRQNMAEWIAHLIPVDEWVKK